MEKKGILGNTTGRRPGDVMWQSLGNRRGCDETSPLTATYELGGTNFKGTQYIFCAMILGAVNVEGEEVLRQLFRFVILVVNLLLIVVGHGLECRATSSDRLRNLFSIVLMVASSLTM